MPSGIERARETIRGLTEKELKQRLGDKHSIESWREIPKAERESRLRSAYLAPGSTIFACCEELGLGLPALSKIMEDNKFRAREFLERGEGGREEHAHNVEERTNELERHSEQIIAALALVNALLDPGAFSESQEKGYQGIEGWRGEVSAIILANGRPGWATLPVTDADGDPLCGRVIADLQGNITDVEGARIASDGARLGKDEREFSIIVDGKTYRVSLTDKVPRAALESSPSSGPGRSQLDNGRVFRLSDMKDIPDDVGKITLEKRLEGRLEGMGLSSKEGMASAIRSLLTLYSDKELGLRVEDERAGWKKVFGGGKIRGLTFITRIPERFMALLPSAIREQGGKLLVDHSRMLALKDSSGADERGAQYGTQPPRYPNVAGRSASLPELADSMETVEVPRKSKERLRDILSVSDRPFYDEWLQRTPLSEQRQRMELVVRYGRDHLLAVTDLLPESEKNPGQQERLRSIKDAVSDPAFIEGAVAYVFGSRTVPPPFLSDVLYHGRMVASQLANGNMGDYLEGRKTNQDAKESIHTVQDILSTIVGTAERGHDEPSLVQAIKNGVVTLETEGFKNLASEYRVEIPLGKGFSFKPELLGSLGPDGDRPGSALFLQREFHLGKNKDIVLEIGAGPSGPHVHLVRRAKTSFSLEVETGWNWAGFGMEVDGWVQWYDARQRSEAEWTRMRSDSGLVELSSELSRALRGKKNDEERLSALHRAIHAPDHNGTSATLRRFLSGQVRDYMSGFGEEPERKRTETILFLRALRAYDSALQESSAFAIADRAPRITGVKFGLLLENGLVIPLFGPILRKGIRLRQSYRMGVVEDPDEGELEGKLRTAPFLKMVENRLDADAVNAELRKTTIHPQENGAYHFTFDALERNPYRDRTTYEVYADPDVGFSWDRATNEITASGFSFVLERTVIAANGLPLVRLELYRDKPHAEHGDHHYDPRVLVARSVPFAARTSKGKVTGGILRQTFTVASHPTEVQGRLIAPENVQVVSRLEQQPILPGPVEIRDRRSYGLFANPLQPMEAGVQFIPGAGHVH